jgi:hypothetical protein
MMLTIDLFGESELTPRLKRIVINDILLNNFSVKAGRTKERLNVISNIHSMEI